MKKPLVKPFILFLMAAAVIGCFLVFGPFLIEIAIAAVLATSLYAPYMFFVRAFRGRRGWAAFVMCLLVIAFLIIPITELVIVMGKKSVTAYSATVNFLNNYDTAFRSSFLSRIDVFGFDNSSLKNLIMDATGRSSAWLMNAATTILKETTSFIVSLFLIVLTMFFFFIDGERMLKKLMLWSPLPNEYDLRIFRKFRDVSHSTIISTFVTAAAQGLFTSFGMLIAGQPALFAGVLTAVCSLIPYLGSAIIYVPIGVFLLLTGQVWQGIFILAWGAVVVGNVDNIIRGYMIKDKANVNPIFVIFSIFGGITLFGFWGIILGPLVISVAITVFHIYELEYNGSLEK